MPSSKNISSLVINEVPSLEIFNSMKSQGLVNEDELYLVNEGGGSSSGSGLPIVTSLDNGKFLRVVNGSWTAVAVPSAEGSNF